MDGPVGVIYLLKKSAAYHQMTAAERAAIDARVGEMIEEVLARGGKRLGRYDARWSSEWDYVAAVEFPDWASYRDVIRRKEQIGYFRAFDATLIVGTALPQSEGTPK